MTRRITTLAPLPPAVPTPANRKFQRARDFVRRTLLRIITERRQQPADAHHDLLQLLVHLRYEDTAQGMTDDQIISEAISFFFAGHETTADTLAWTIYLAIYNLHHHPRYWGEPECFNPDRFSPEGRTQWPKHAYLPFGAGPRMCIGKPFGLAEAHLALANMIQRLAFELPEGYVARPNAVFNMGIRGGLPVIVARR